MLLAFSHSNYSHSFIWHSFRLLMVYRLVVGRVLSTGITTAVTRVVTKELENLHLTQPQPQTTCTLSGYYPEQQTASPEMKQYSRWGLLANWSARIDTN